MLAAARRAASRHVLHHMRVASSFANARRYSGPSGDRPAVFSEKHSPFVSKYHQVDPGTITAYLTRKDLEFKIVPGEIVVKACPFCPKPHGNKADNLWKLYFSTSSGTYYCFRCGCKGSFFDFKQRLGDLGADVTPVGSSVSPGPDNRTAVVSPPPKRVSLPEVVEPSLDLLERDKFPPVLSYLTETRGLKLEVLREYLVGAKSYPFRQENSTAWQHHDCIVFPWLSNDGTAPAAAPSDDLSTTAADEGEAPPSAVEGAAPALRARRWKVRSITQKSAQMTLPSGGEKGMFGMHTVPPTARSVVITEGEFDAMSVRQATGAFAVSLPNGARSLPVELLPWLERFEKIYLWLDNDEAGREGAEKLVAKLGRGRCLLVRPSPDVHREGKPPKDANEALVRGMDLSVMLNSAAPQPHDQILSFEDLKTDVYRELVDPVTVAGTPYRWLPSLQSMLKGHRNGEITLLTGPTGSGKTTLLSQVSLDLCDQGIPTLWGSFEIKNVRLLKRLMTQYAGRDLNGISEAEFDMISNQFSNLPLYFLKFFGSTDVNRVLDAMDYAVYVNDVEHIVLDNLQFMLGASASKGFDKFDQQERALDQFRQFATSKNVHITLVVHPRKEAESTSLGINSVFGTAKATQEADNVIILQHTPEGKYLDIRKNRFDGTLGHIPVQFDQASLTFREPSQPGKFKPSTATPVATMLASSQQFGVSAFPLPGAHTDFLSSTAVSRTEASSREAVVREVTSGNASDGSGANGSGSFAAKAKKKLGRPKKSVATAPAAAGGLTGPRSDSDAGNSQYDAAPVLAMDVDDSLLKLNGSSTSSVDEVPTPPPPSFDSTATASATAQAALPSRALDSFASGSGGSGSEDNTPATTAPKAKAKRLKKVVHEIIMS